MDSKRIEELLTKYWDCQTSLEEEQQLREYFRSADIPEQLKETAMLFRYFEESRDKTLNDVSFNKAVLSKMKTPEQGKVVKWVYNTMRIAAGVVVLMVAIWFIHKEVQEPTQQAAVDTYNDPKLAFEETKRALLMISKSFGKAEEQAKKINLFNEAQENIKKKETSKNNL